MHTHETLVLHRHHRSISTRDKKKEKKRKEKKSSYNSSINKVRSREKISFRNESSHCVNPSSRNLTISSLPLPPPQSRNGSRSDDTTTILRFLDFHFALLYLRSQTVTRLLRKLGSFLSFFLFFYSSLVSKHEDSSKSYNSGVVILFFCKRRRKTEGKRAITSTRRSIDR